MIGPVRAWRRRRIERWLRIRVPLAYRSLFESGDYPPPPPPPVLLREAADVLEAAFVADISDWLRELADRLPEPFVYREHFAPPLVDYLPTLADIRQHHRTSGLCTASSPRLWPCGMPYTCTLGDGHAGAHMSQGPDDEVYDTWPA